MSLNEKLLQEELSTLKVDFDKTKKSVETMEKETILQRNNLNAIYGAIQQVDKLIAKDSGTTSEKQLLTEKQPMPAEKQQALDIATS